MMGDDMFHDGEAKPRAALRAAGRRVDAVEPFGETRDMFRRDARPVVRDGEDAETSVLSHIEFDDARSAVFDRVLDEIFGDAEKFVAIAAAPGRARDRRAGW